ncbi:hypothetical protein BDB00DRAFT_855632 [Zychaea mexicana]|uniref:uncharacterized protein n=1 Tax=Zychaea mexicana TaxID=64656 RepID=UPI0022FEF146|nr:uncharacterized protein BDB00DRAFT_855632 [Zychaea mexicana]KAI9484425.1 hypothetical protein BDB00DRAFT_855632 [Zychaea mexicana]
MLIFLIYILFWLIANAWVQAHSTWMLVACCYATAVSVVVVVAVLLVRPARRQRLGSRA